MSTIQIGLEVVGPNRGKTFTFRDYRFKDGRIMLSGTIEQLGGALVYLESTCQAYPIGSDKLAEMIELIHGKEKTNGERQADEGARGGQADEVPGGVPEVAQPPANPAPAVGEGAAGAATGGEGVRPEGNGPERPTEVVIEEKKGGRGSRRT